MKKKSPPIQADTETRATSEHAESLRLWLRMLTCTNMIEGQIRSRLRQTFDITLPRFDLMAQLERVPQGMKMNELSKRMMVTCGNITVITDQLVAEGLVTRTAIPQDRRAYNIKLTAKGLASFSEMAKAHEMWIVDLLEGLSQNERTTLYDLLAKVKLQLARVSDEKNPAQR